MAGENYSTPQDMGAEATGVDRGIDRYATRDAELNDPPQANQTGTYKAEHARATEQKRREESDSWWERTKARMWPLS